MQSEGQFILKGPFLRIHIEYIERKIFHTKVLFKSLLKELCVNVSDRSRVKVRSGENSIITIRSRNLFYLHFNECKSTIEYEIAITVKQIFMFIYMLWVSLYLVIRLSLLDFILYICQKHVRSKSHKTPICGMVIVCHTQQKRPVGF